MNLDSGDIPLWACQVIGSMSPLGTESHSAMIIFIPDWTVQASIKSRPTCCFYSVIYLIYDSMQVISPEFQLLCLQNGDERTISIHCPCHCRDQIRTWDSHFERIN